MRFKCPWCSSQVEATGKEWTYAAFYVKQYRCLECKKYFMAYYQHEKLSHVIPKNVSTKRKIITYLRANKVASPQSMADALNLKIQDIINVLSELEKEGLVIPSS